jgi:anaerobic ribonucleoside-triphosphate reductase
LRCAYKPPQRTPDDPIAKKCVDGYPAVEEIQDLVEQALMELDYFETAKAYIIYRNERKKLRERDIFKKANQSQTLRISRTL